MQEFSRMTEMFYILSGVLVVYMYTSVKPIQLGKIYVFHCKYLYLYKNITIYSHLKI